MYSKTVEFKDLNGRPRSVKLYFNLMETEVLKLLVEFKTISDWRSSLLEEEGIRELDPVEVVAFYTAFEEVLLSAHGRPVEDGLRFEKSNRYEFAESLAFNAVMMHFVSNPAEVGQLLEALLPKGIQEMVEKQDANLALAAEKAKDVNSRAEIERLRAELAKIKNADES